MPVVAVLDYGASNNMSMTSALRKAGLDVLTTSDPGPIEDVDAVVIPGVGHFTQASQRLRSLQGVLKSIIQSGRPVLGVCLGMQILFESSEESTEPGLGVLRGHCIKIRGVPKTPHMGWNSISIVGDTPLLEGVEDGAFVYFVHSYHVSPLDMDVISAVTHYGSDIVSVIRSGDIHGTQFHPEKSGPVGKTILRNFYRIVRG
ncbi:MAG: imidazole glycerol phosphate synthase subunit HisH [Candidatus Thorarchaeota archaeon]